VIHRDLKPENILIQHGQPVIADFGIALAISKAGGSRVTQTGLSLGTPQYMSPEQATGDRVIDGRSDIYSLGAILYEMLAGEPPHVGGTVQATIAKVLTDPVRPLRGLRETVPVQVERAVAKALAKLPADRFASASLFVRALEAIRPDSRPLPPRAQRVVERGCDIRPRLRLRRCWRRRGLRGVCDATRLEKSNDTRTIRFDFVTPPGAKVRLTFGSPMALSPDGRTLVYVGEAPRGTQLWIRDLESGTSRPLVGTDEPEAPTFSPDGRWIVFRMNARAIVAKIPVSGGPVEVLYTANALARVTFFTNDSLVFSTSEGGTFFGHLFNGSLAGGVAKPFCSRIPPRCRRRSSIHSWLRRQHTHLHFSERRAKHGRVIAGDAVERVAVPTEVQATSVLATLPVT
jgi:serine/threonine-protein kinase